MSFELGRSGEQYVLNLLTWAGFSVETSKGNFIDYDLLCRLDKKTFSCEVKFDVMSQKTGNLAIEVHNTKQDKPSGLEATKADLWFFVLKDGAHTVCYATNTKMLRNYVKMNEPKKIVEFAGDHNARILLYDMFTILGDIFTRLDDGLEEEDVRGRILRLLKSKSAGK